MSLPHRSRLYSSTAFVSLLAVFVVVLSAADLWADEQTPRRASLQKAKPRPLMPTEVFSPQDPPFLREVHLGPFEARKYIEEDAQAPFGPVRTGVAREVIVTVDDGQWQLLEGIGWLWTVAVVSDGATAVRVHFSNVNMPEGGQLGIRDRSGVHKVFGPYEGKGRHDSGEFWTSDIFGDTALVEYFWPNLSAVPLELPFVIDQVMHNYHPMFSRPEDRGTREGDCHPDIMCYPTWAKERDATAVLLTIAGPSSWSCTGTLLETVTLDETPYLLTASHCVDTDTEAQNTTAYWFYQSESCDGPAPWLGDCPTSDDGYVVATSGGSGNPPDQTLLMVQGALPTDDPDWTLSWAGWSQFTLGPGNPVVAVHHPGGYFDNERKRIAFGDSVDDPWGDNTNFVGVYWDSPPPDHGTYEGGSSGSGLYKASNHLLYGVASACALGTDCDDPEGPCNAGRFSRFYSTENLSSIMQAGSDDDFDDNDDCPTAYAIGAGDYTNRIVKSTDEDWYKITIPANHRLLAYVSFTSAHGDIDLELFDACGGMLLDSAHGTGGFESVTYNNYGYLMDPYLRVYLASDTRQTYTLNISFTPLSCCSCVGDLESITGGGCNDVVNITDFTIFAVSYPSVLGDANYHPCCDFDDDGYVNITDFTEFANHYLQPCP